MNLHQVLQLALNDCNLGASISNIDWVSNDEVIRHIKLCLSFKADDAAYENWQAAFSQNTIEGT